MILTQDQLTLENSLRRILPAGVVSCWIPDGYNRAKDIIGGNHGQCYGTHPNVPVLPNLSDPSVGWVFGVDDYIRVPDHPSLDVTDELTTGAWVKLSALGVQQGPMGKHTSPGAGWWSRIKLADNKIQSLVVTVNGNLLTTSTTAFTTDWILYTTTYDGTNVKISFNGEDKTGAQAGEGSGNIINSDTDLVIGAAWAVLYRLNGFMVFPFMANKALSQQEQANIGLATKSLFSPRGF